MDLIEKIILSRVVDQSSEELIASLRSELQEARDQVEKLQEALAFELVKNERFKVALNGFCSSKNTCNENLTCAFKDICQPSAEKKEG